MWRKIFRVLYILAFLLVTGLLIYYLFLAEEKNLNRISQAGTIFITCIWNMFRSKKGRGKATPKLSAYEKEYENIIGGAFAEDKKSYKKLLQVTRYYNNDKYEKALRLIAELLKNCKSARDYSAVYMFKALCLEEKKDPEAAKKVYERLLQYDMTNSSAWSNLGLLYMEQGKMSEAKEAFFNAIANDSQNAYAYNNMATYYIETGEPETALKYALKSVELDGRLYQPLSAAAIAYHMLGDAENAEKFYRMYGVHGGDAKELRSVLESL